MPAQEKPIPAFYCCYLLRAKNRKSYYIGSTPNPPRRLSQHNGLSKGGAKRTSMQGRRPWQMTCFISGFPSNIAALQFEWAWENAHASRHIEPHIRDARTKSLQKKKKPATKPEDQKGSFRPPASLEARLKNLCHLCSVKSFNRWPLQIRFFSQDVFDAWKRHTANIDPGPRSDITVILTPAQSPAAATEDRPEDDAYTIPAVISEVPVAYEDSKAFVEKSRALLAVDEVFNCKVCRGEIDQACSLAVLCPVTHCNTVSHMSCLSTKFLEDEGVKDAIVPLGGACPGCQRPIKWADIAKELSLRTRGQAEIDALLKSNRKQKPTDPSRPIDFEPPAPLSEDDDLDDTWMDDLDDAEDGPVDMIPL